MSSDCRSPSWQKSHSPSENSCWYRLLKSKSVNCGVVKINEKQDIYPFNVVFVVDIIFSQAWTCFENKTEKLEIWNGTTRIVWDFLGSRNSMKYWFAFKIWKFLKFYILLIRFFYETGFFYPFSFNYFNSPSASTSGETLLFKSFLDFEGFFNILSRFDLEIWNFQISLWKLLFLSCLLV